MMESFTKFFTTKNRIAIYMIMIAILMTSPIFYILVRTHTDSILAGERRYMYYIICFSLILYIFLAIFSIRAVHKIIVRDLSRLQKGIEHLSYDINYQLPAMSGKMGAVSHQINELAVSIAVFFNFASEIECSRELDIIYGKIVGCSSKLLDNKRVVLFIIDDDYNIKPVKSAGFGAPIESEYNDGNVITEDDVAKKVLQDKKPIIINDISDGSYHTLLQRITPKENIVSAIYIPLIIHDDVKAIIAAFSEQENEFNNKHVNILTVLGNHGAYAIENAMLINKLGEEAIIDHLTGLYNRRYMEIAIHEELCKAERFGHSLSCAMIDIDYYKNINDRYGHGKGDIVLKKLACIIKSSIRGYDIAIRYGGEEFLIIMPQTYMQVAALIMERIRKTVEDTVFEMDGTDIKLTVSIGVAEWNSVTKDYNFINSADKALYRAKALGRNRVERAVDADSQR